MTDKHIAVTIMFLAAAAVSCGGKGGSTGGGEEHPLPDTLHVVTLYSPTSYFSYREEEMGYDYTLISGWCREKGMVLDLKVAPRLETAVQWLDSGLVDMVAYEVPVTGDYRQRVVPCGPTSVTTQVLVQPRSEGAITDVTQLVGRTVYVVKDSKYQQRLENLNAELGGGIDIRTIDRDTLITEDVLEMVASGQIPLTVVDSDVAHLNKTYYPGLDITLSLSFGQKSSWGVAPGNEWLADSVNAWFGTTSSRRLTDEVYKRYFEESKAVPQAKFAVDFSKGRISQYDELFRRYAPEIGWDWRLLASLGYVESRFDNSVVSWAGAKGIMQIMPGTARALGFSQASLTDPESSVKMAVKLLKSMDRLLKPHVSDPAQRRLFILAAYNSGGAHILDAIALAKKYGNDPQRWYGAVEQSLLLKADPAYYNDPVVKYGYFRGRQTVQFVREIEDFYNKARKNIKE